MIHPRAHRSVVAAIALAGLCGVPATAAPPATDPDYQRAGVIHARHYRVVTELAMDEVGSFAKLTPKARSKLAALRRVSSQTVDVYALPERVLIVLSGEHPGGPLDILLCDDIDRIFVIDHQRKRIASLPRERYPDILDMAGSSRRSSFTATLQPAETYASGRGELPPRPTRRRVRTGSHLVKIAFEYRPPGRRTKTWSIRTDLHVTGAGEPGPHHPAHPLYHLALPLLQDARGLHVLESLTFATPAPLGWSRALVNETKGGASVVRRSAVLCLGWVPLPLTRFATARPGHSADLTMWASATEGRQLRPPAELTGLRPGSGSATLRAVNRTPFAALVYIDGALVAWVAPESDLRIEGLSPGFYRLFAVSPTGIRSWGPEDTYLPGPLVLR